MLWRATAGRTVSPTAFLAARATRVVPLYWLASLAVVAAALVWPAFQPEVRPGWRHLALSLAFIPHFDPTGRPFPTLPPGWSLNYEAIFYLLFAAALAAPPKWRAASLLGGLCVATALGFVLADPAYVLGANPLLLEFAAGVALALAMEKSRPRRAGAGVALLAAGALGLAGASLPGVFVEVWRPLLWGLPATLIVAGAVALERSGRFAAPPWLGRLGDASYALYLVHLPVTALLAHAMAAVPLAAFLPAALAASILAALACHVWIERPLTRCLRRRLR